MANFRGWNSVLPGSVLKIHIESQDGGDPPFVAEARFVGDEGDLPPINDAELIPGPAEVTFPAAEHYQGRIWIQFATAGTAVVTAQMRKPDGTDHGKKAEFTIPGQADDRKRVTFIILMKEDGNGAGGA